MNKSLLKLNLNPEEVIEKAKSSTIITKYNNNTAKAKINNVFGSPTFIVRDEIFWGDDRLEDAIQWAKQ